MLPVSVATPSPLRFPREHAQPAHHASLLASAHSSANFLAAYEQQSVMVDVDEERRQLELNELLHQMSVADDGDNFNQNNELDDHYKPIISSISPEELSQQYLLHPAVQASSLNTQPESKQYGSLLHSPSLHTASLQNIKDTQSYSVSSYSNHYAGGEDHEESDIVQRQTELQELIQLMDNEVSNTDGQLHAVQDHDSHSLDHFHQQSNQLPDYSHRQPPSHDNSYYDHQLLSPAFLEKSPALRLDSSSVERTQPLLNEQHHPVNNYEEIIIEMRDQYDRAVGELRSEYEHNLQSMQRAETEKREVLQDQISTLQRELDMVQSNNSSIASIRATLQREKELDILNIKKELLSQKEHQLLEMRSEFSRDKDDLIKRYKDEFIRKELQHNNEQTKHSGELQSVKSKLEEVLQKNREYDEERRHRPMTVDTGQQSDNIELESIRIAHETATKELAETRTQLVRMIRNWTEPSYAPSCLDILSVLQTQIEYDNASSHRIKRDVGIANDNAASAEKRAIQLNNELDLYKARLLQVNSDHVISLQQLTEKNERERSELIDKYKKELSELSERLKEQCRKVYEVSIGKFKNEFKSLNQRLHNKYKQEQKLFRRHSQMEMRQELRLKQDHIRLLENKVSEQQRINHSLQESISTQTEIINKIRSMHTEERNQAVQKVKAQYLETLKSMREDIHTSKRRDMQRLEEEWTRRKLKLHEEHQQEYAMSSNRPI